MLLKYNPDVNIIENVGICSLSGVEENFVGYMCCLAEDDKDALVIYGKKEAVSDTINKVKSFEGRVIIIQGLIYPVDKVLADLITSKSSTCTILADPASCHYLLERPNCTKIEVVHGDTCTTVKPLKSVVFYK